MPFCTRCGSEYAVGAAFCSQCGTTTSAPPSPADEASGSSIAPAAAPAAGMPATASPQGAPPRAATAPGSPSARAAGTPTTRRDFPAASKAKRIVAALIDVGIAVGFMLLLLSLPSGMRVFVRRGIVFRLLSFAPGLYFLLRDSIGGHSIGKMVVGLVVYDISKGRRAGFLESVLRNWPLALAGIPVVGWAIAGLSALVMSIQVLMGRKQRFMDGSATTQVIEERWLTQP